MIRTCTVCLAEKELEEFPKAAHGKLGRRNQCIECRKAYHKAHYKLYYAKNREAKIAKVVARENLLREQGKLTPSPFRSTEAFRERERLRKRRIRSEASPELRRHLAYLSRKYLARKAQAPGYCTKQQLQWRWEYYDSKCWVCAEPATETDHVIPLSKGGTNWPGNLKPICKPCNVRKSNIWPYNPKLQSKEHTYANAI